MTTPQLLDKREARIRRMFGQIAPCYDFLNHLLSLNIDRRWRRTTARLVPAGPPELGPVLDLCTGTGDLALTYDAATGGTVPVVGPSRRPSGATCGRPGGRAACGESAGRVIRQKLAILAILIRSE